MSSVRAEQRAGSRGPESASCYLTDAEEVEPPARNSHSPTRPPLSRQIGWTLAGNVGYALAQSLMLVMMAKTVHPQMLGKFGLGLAISTPIFTLASLQLRSLQATDASRGVEFSDFLGLRLVMVCAALLAVLAVVGAVGYPPVTAMVVAAVALGKGSEAVADTLYGELQRAERMRPIAQSMLLRGITALVLLSVLLLATRSILWGAIGITAASMLVLFMYDLPRLRRLSSDPPVGVRAASFGHPGKPRLARKAVKQIVSLGLPLGLASVLLSLAATTPRYLLERYNGEEALGLFVALAYPAVAFGIVISACGQAAAPRLANYYRTRRERYNRLVLVLCAVPLVVALLAAPIILLCGPRLLAFVYSEVYAVHWSEFLLLATAGLVTSVASALGYAATSSGRILPQAPGAVVILVGTAIAGWSLIPRLGLQGAAVASLMSGTLMLVGAVVILLWPSKSEVEKLRGGGSRVRT